MTTPGVGNRILSRMLDRLFAAIVSGPSLNARPHNSRQRIDLTQFEKLGDIEPAKALHNLLSEAAATRLVSRIAAPTRTAAAKRPATDAGPTEEASVRTPEQIAADKAWSEHQSLITKLRVVVDEARTYEEDTGVYVLNLGFPVISLPPGAVGGRGAASRRVLAPIAFIPVAVTIKSGASPSVEIECKSDEIDRVAPNEALLAWIEQQTREKPAEMFADEEGTQPWREIALLTQFVAKAFNIAVPEIFRNEALPESIPLVPAPKADEDSGPTIHAAAVLGLYPMANQGLLRDVQAMTRGEFGPGPIESFLRSDATFDRAAPETEDARPQSTKRTKTFGEERLVARADPCQARAVALARSSAGLVIHGPPGTGKSQTISNIIGDHLARGERVLFVCDKRTALDVVANRLSHLGLGDLCALIHDPQRDQRELYMAIREQLESLAEVSTQAGAEKSLGRIDAELGTIHADLTRIHAAISRPGSEQEHSLHDVLGQWLAIDAGELEVPPAEMAGVGLAELEKHTLPIGEALRRAIEVSYPSNPWKAAAGIAVETLVSRPMDHYRTALAACERAAADADAAADSRIPAFDASLPLEAQAAAREKLLAALERALSDAPVATRRLWTDRTPEQAERASRTMRDTSGSIDGLRSATMDTEVLATIREQPPAIAEVVAKIGTLESYLSAARAWWGFLAFGRKSAAAKVLLPLGLPVSVQGAERAAKVYAGLRSAMTVRTLIHEFEGSPAGAGLPDRDSLDRSLRAHAAVLDTLTLVRDDATLRPLAGFAVQALAAEDPSPAMEGLRRSRARAVALGTLESAIQAAGLFATGWMTSTKAAARGGGLTAEAMRGLSATLRTLEDVVRVQAALAAMPATLTGPVGRLLDASATAEDGLAAIRRAVLGAEVTRRLAADADLRALDPRRIQSLFERYGVLEVSKRDKVREAILHRWVTAQKERLVVSTGSRLSPAGADVRRRLTTRGKHAMRLRQVLALGRGMEGGDPLMDLRPVWMASPETVAQIFPREAIFDVVVFDEASQCRLEEALPVLTRAKRVVIAGDPKQLPPTRFFESAVAASENEEIESDQQLFEAQQSEVEDLLTAALGLDIQQSYLDVHYRSRNSDLIEFSNEQFYSRRLQAIPAHPRQKARFSPLTLYPVKGVYDKRTNLPEAEQVGRIVRDLLKRADPPSIGIGCFNLAQRDLIVETLEEMASEDAEFARALATARSRKGAAAFEGLFVKNLENVQGDERDHIIISTTYGPDKEGRFYRRFGPLAMPGGGRRLNVLVTRARDEVHLVTSIPRDEYHSLPPIPPGQTPGGGWLLFAYLNYAETLAARYEQLHKVLEAPRTHDDAEHPIPAPHETVINATRAPSAFAESLGHHLAARESTGGIVHWGNDGFCIDVALRHPTRPDDVTVGVLCDLTRFPLADDPVEWDMFRTGVLESQGWVLERLWSPVFFRDPRGCIDEVLRSAAAVRDAGDARE